MYPEYEDEPLPQKSEYIFQVGYGIAFNEECVNVLKQFNLGNSTLTPLKIHKLFTDELWLEDTFYFLNLCEQREYLVNPQPNEDCRFIPYYGNNGAYVRPELTMADNAITIHQSALECDLDLWHDPLLHNSYFLSD